MPLEGRSLAAQIAGVALAGACGALARWGTATATQAITGTGFPWGTWVVNVVGCFLYGMLYQVLERFPAHRDWGRLLLLTGFLGALTTFSTLVHDSWQLHSARGAPGLALANVAGQFALGLLALLLGFAISRAL